MIAIVGVLSAVFVVDEREKALVLRFGQIKQVRNEPGIGYRTKPGPAKGVAIGQQSESMYMVTSGKVLGACPSCNPPAAPPLPAARLPVHLSVRCVIRYASRTCGPDPHNS